MSNFNFDPVEVPQALRDPMYEAYDALANKRAQVDRLKAAKSSVLQEIATAKADLEQRKASYMATFVDDVSGDDADPTAPMEHREGMAHVGGFIYSAEATLPDFEAAIAKAEAEMKPLQHAYVSARNQIVRVFVRRSPKGVTSRSDLIGFADFYSDEGVIGLENVMMLYMATFDAGVLEMGAPFDEATGARRFFTFINSFFRGPSPQEVQVFRDRFNALIWGDHEPEPKVQMPENQIPNGAPLPTFDFASMGRT